MVLVVVASRGPGPPSCPGRIWSPAESVLLSPPFPRLLSLWEASSLVFQQCQHLVRLRCGEFASECPAHIRRGLVIKAEKVFSTPSQAGDRGRFFIGGT